MKSVAVTSSATTGAAADDGDRSPETSCYFPGCRKDANCKCEICLASINATLDLKNPRMTKNPKFPPKSPIPFDDSRVLSTPVARNSRPTLSPPLNSTARVSFHDKVKRKKRDFGIKVLLFRLVSVMGLVFAVEFGFGSVLSRVLRPELGPEIVMDLVGKVRGSRDLGERLGLLQKELQSLVSGEVSDCGSNGSLWRINQDDPLLNSECTLHKSAIEEVNIWGWPLQTAGLLTAEFSSRSLFILSGRVTKWSDGKLSNLTMKANQSWVQKKWSASIVQLDRNTWIIEYKRAKIIENSRLISAVLELLKFRLSRELSRIKQDFWFLPYFGSEYNGFYVDRFKVPT